MKLRRCTSCRREKPATGANFARLRGDLQTQCKVCLNEKADRYRKKNRKTISEKMRLYYKRKKVLIRQKIATWRLKHPDKVRSTNLRCAHGISIEEYSRMLIAQGMRCAICRRHRNAFKRRLAVDHDHETGLNRALLCHGCNTMLGYAKEDVERLLAAIAYLRKHQRSRKMP